MRPFPVPSRSFLPQTGWAVLAGTLLFGCSSPDPTTSTKSAAPTAAAAASPAFLGAKADSLAGIPGHHFGEPRRNFPELEPHGSPAMPEVDSHGELTVSNTLSYVPRPGKEKGWFGKNNDQVRTTYWFYQDAFFAFSAQADGSGRQLLADEVNYLFGKGALQNGSFGESTTRWEGRKVLVTYVDGHNEGRLSVSSQAVLAQLAAAKRAKHQADSVARAVKFRADNAPGAQ